MIIEEDLRCIVLILVVILLNTFLLLKGLYKISNLHMTLQRLFVAICLAFQIKSFTSIRINYV